MEFYNANQWILCSAIRRLILPGLTMYLVSFQERYELVHSSESHHTAKLCQRSPSPVITGIHLLNNFPGDTSLGGGGPELLAGLKSLLNGGGGIRPSGGEGGHRPAGRGGGNERRNGGGTGEKDEGRKLHN